MSQNHLYNTPKEKRAILKLQAWVIGKQERKRYKQMQKKAKYRRNVITELLNTEKSYLADIQLIIEKVMGPIHDGNVIDHEEQHKVFLNLQQIKNFNQDFFQALQVSFQKYSPYSVVFANSNKLIQGFHFYFDYCNGFQGACKLQEKLKDNPKWTTFLQEIRQKNVLRGMDLQSFLVKPVQRLPKYVLLYKDLLKHTNDDHADYGNIAQGLKSFMQVNEENNKNMDKFLSRLRLQEIQQTLNLSQDELTKDPDRLFRFEETLTLIQGDRDQPVLVYALTDKIIVAERKVVFVDLLDKEENSELIKILDLDSLSFLKDQTDSKYFSHLFSIVCNEGLAQFQAESSQSKRKIMEVFEQLIEELREIERKKYETTYGQPMVKIYPVQVMVCGTEERAYQGFQKHTVFITEITISKIALKIFVRYSEIKKLNERVKSGDLKQLYSKVHVTAFPNETWITNHKTKVIEQRKISIENFLQLILQANVTRQQQRVLEEINLPPKFYDLPDIYAARQLAKIQQLDGPKTRISMVPYQQEKTMDGMKQLEKLGVNIENLQKSAGEILFAYQEDRKQAKISATSLLPSQMIVNKGSTLPGQFKIEIFIPDGSFVKLGISQDTRASEIVSEVASQIKIIHHADYRLYILDQLNNYRILDDDEVVQRVIEEETNNGGYIKGMFNKVEQMLASSKNGITFHFKKYIYLPFNLEEHDFRTDHVRMRQVAFQILDFVHSEKFYIQFKDYCFYAAIYYHMKFPELMNSNIDTLELDKVSNVVPKNIYKTNSEKLWIQNTRELIKLLKTQIDSFVTQNVAAQMRGLKQEYALLVDPTHIAYLIAYNSIRQNKLAGIGVFYVETHPNMMTWMQKQKLEIYPNIYLGVSCQKLHYLTPSRKEIFKSFEFIKITSIKSYPMQIIFKMENYKDEQLVRFNTYQSNEIKNLIEYYRNLQQFNKDYDLGINVKS